MLGTYGIISLILGWFLFKTTKAQPFFDSINSLSTENIGELLTKKFNQNPDESLDSKSYDELKNEYNELVVDWLVEKGGEVEQYLQDISDQLNLDTLTDKIDDLYQKAGDVVQDLVVPAIQNFEEIEIEKELEVDDEAFETNFPF